MAASDRRWEASNSGISQQTRRADQPLRPQALKLPLPLPLLVLDGVGAVVVGLGAAEYFGKVPLLSRVVDLPDIALLAMVTGGVLMGVAVTGIVLTVIRRNATR